MGVARAEVNRYMRERGLPEYERENLDSVAYEMLCKAAATWDKEKNSFPSWASFKIRGALFDEGRRTGPVSRRGVTRLSEVQLHEGLLLPSLPSDPDGELLEGMLDGLGARERYILERRFIDDQTLEEIAQEFGITASRTHQLQKKALDKLRERIVDPKAWLLTRRGPLTPRMVEVVQLCADGRSIQETASVLGCSTTNVKDLRRRAQKRLSGKNVYNTVAIALRRGLIH